MTLFLAILIIYGLPLPEWLYILAGMLWLMRFLILCHINT